MEIFELRYFLAVALEENIHRASENINVSPGSLSKAISRLEDKLQTSLFHKSGRGIRLTPEGEILKRRAIQMLNLEDDIRTEISGAKAGALNVHLASEEVLQVGFLPKLARKIVELFPHARVHCSILSEGDAIEQVRDGETHLTMITSDPPKDLVSRTIASVKFVTCASSRHPLVRHRREQQLIPIEEVLKHGFVVPRASMLGHIAKTSSLDGWRDDKFQRRMVFKVNGLRVMENLIQEGLALAYLPDYFVDTAGLVALKISGCPYTCEQTVRLVTKDPKELGWLSRLWHDLDRFD
jgi:DNA-binding transcriptional LysR family regulator